jgi:serine protease Do
VIPRGEAYNFSMTRRFAFVTMGLVGTVTFLIGLIVAGSMTPAPAHSAPEPRVAPTRAANAGTAAPALASFADIAERLNPAVVNIDATVPAAARPRRRSGPQLPDSPELFERPGIPDREAPRRGAGTGFLIDASGHILTNYHVIADASRIMVRLTDGRTLRAKRIGSDPDTDIALIKIEAPRPLPHAALGDSGTLRVGEWVLAIGNPLAYEHTVTVGVVSYIGRQLFDGALDRYIQTDAAINFGNSGGPLINARGEVIGINAAISSRASNIGFAVPINQASEILPQLREHGRVSRGYIGVSPRNVDPDLQRLLGLSSHQGALVEDVTDGSPAARAGIRPYDVIVSIDGRAIADNGELIRAIASRRPGTQATLQLLRDGRSMNVGVKLAERPPRERAQEPADDRPQPSSRREVPLGLSVRGLDAGFAERYGLPAGTEGVIVSRVEPMGPAFDAKVVRGHVVLEIDRQPVRSVEDYRRLTSRARAGDVLTLYLYKPDTGRALHTLKIE